MSAFAASAALLNSRLVRQPARNQALAAAYEFGEIETALALPLPGGLARVDTPRNMRPNSAKQRQVRSYDRAQSHGRKRMMGGDGRLPNTIRSGFTEGERAVLSVIGAEVKQRGVCELSVLTIARRAGVGVRLVQYTLAAARTGTTRRGDERPQLIQVEYRREPGRAFNETNIITIISREWLLWLHYRPSEAPPTGCTEVRPNWNPSSYPLSYAERSRAKARAAMPQGACERGSAPAAAARARERRV